MYKLYSILNSIAPQGNESSAYSAFKDYEKALGDAFSFSSSQFSSRIKLNETDSQYELSLELPGYGTKDVEVSVEEKILIVKAKNEKFGETVKTLALWSGIVFDEISGKMENGILVVSLPKEKKKSKKIKVD